jgi:diadenosine tetraphosphate (Ap4A) HIT family hydrolase
MELDPRLAADSVALGRFDLCELRLMNDANFPWLLLVPARPGVSELHELPEPDQLQLMRESCFLGRRLAGLFQAHKLNVAALGNVVAQLHVHHVVRYRHDPAWPRPVWGRLPPRPYTPAQIADLRRRINGALAGGIPYLPLAG